MNRSCSLITTLESYIGTKLEGTFSLKRTVWIYLHILALICAVIAGGCGRDSDPCSGIDDEAVECQLDGECEQGWICWCSVCVPGGCDGVIEFSGNGLEYSIRQQIGKNHGGIRFADVKDIKTFNPSEFVELDSIGGLRGIQCLISLEELYLGGQGVLDFEPLYSMKKLGELYLSFNGIESVDSFPELPSLIVLDLSYNDIVDINPLSKFTGLNELNLSKNLIDDINVLSGLTSLTKLDMSWNKIEDITPIVENSEIGNGDFVSVEYNWIDCADQATNIQTLRDRGVDLVVNCP